MGGMPALKRMPLPHAVHRRDLGRVFSAEQAKVLHTLDERITVRKSGITINWHDKGLNKLLLDTLEP
jgi:hypothetical protein